MNRLLLDGFKKVKFSIEIDVRDQVCLKIDERLRNKIQMKFFSVAQVMDIKYKLIDEITVQISELLYSKVQNHFVDVGQITRQRLEVVNQIWKAHVKQS